LSRARMVRDDLRAAHRLSVGPVPMSMPVPIKFAAIRGRATRQFHQRLPITEWPTENTPCPGLFTASSTQPSNPKAQPKAAQRHSHPPIVHCPLL
jgi:hypothetical protein